MECINIPKTPASVGFYPWSIRKCKALHSRGNGSSPFQSFAGSYQSGIHIKTHLLPNIWGISVGQFAIVRGLELDSGQLLHRVGAYQRKVSKTAVKNIK